MFKQRVIYSLLMVSLPITTALGNPIPFQNNQTVAVTFSATNYNRLIIKDDKIVEAYFPEKSLDMKRDGEDGSVYVLLDKKDPFTVFLTTEKGRHLAVTVQSEEGLGKTIELLPPPLNHPIMQPIANKSKPLLNEWDQLITQMEKQALPPTFSVNHASRAIQRLGNGLIMTKIQSWIGNGVESECFELYNSGRDIIHLSKQWFQTNDIKAMKLAESTLAPHEKVLLYRVRG